MDYYNNRQSMCRRGKSTCRTNQPVMFSAPSVPGESCPYQGVDRLPLAMAYVPWQRWGNLYEPCKGIQVGTIFEDLDLPFSERSCLKP